MQEDNIAAALQRAADWDALTPNERSELVESLRRARLTQNALKDSLAERTFGQRLADRIAAFGGSWKFIMIFFTIMIAWSVINTILLTRKEAFDPYPYIFLNLMLSMLAALQAPVIMMSQHRQTMRDQADAKTDYEINLKAEIEIRALHDKIDTLRDAQWVALLALQHDQIRLLERLVTDHDSTSEPQGVQHSKSA
ncbi:MAG: DUF1003 domain-containing protein [Gemmatimonadaceae bacterium]